MSSFIPKERSSGYRPWQLKSLEGGGNKQARDQNDADRIKAINQQAYQQGYDAGYAQGAARAQTEAARLAQLIEVLQHETTGLEQRIAEDLLRLALALARSLLRESLAVHPELVAAIVREAIAEVPPFSQGTRLRLHPQDAALLRAHLEREPGADWIVVEDASLLRGGCRIETAAGEIDATLQTRWQKLSSALAQDHEWMA
ncbi:MAG: flagellar assembly protein FliH [Burkholderiales bacterium]|nr:flagellar assembly protein FliH [Burkholderiales bacterium]